MQEVLLCITMIKTADLNGIVQRLTTGMTKKIFLAMIIRMIESLAACQQVLLAGQGSVGLALAGLANVHLANVGPGSIAGLVNAGRDNIAGLVLVSLTNAGRAVNLPPFSVRAFLGTEKSQCLIFDHFSTAKNL